MKFNSLTVVMTALDEEDNLEQAVNTTLETFKENSIDWELVLINDGSRDRTGQIAAKLAKDESRIKIIHHERPMGIGFCFREGIRNSSKDAITWLPGDGENDPHEIIKYLPLLEYVDIIVPFVANTKERPWARRVISRLFQLIIAVSFFTTFKYTNGNVIYKRSVFLIVENKANGFFYQTECLVRAVRSGFIYAEVPVYIKARTHGHSKAFSLRSFYLVFVEFIRLFVSANVLREEAKKGSNLSGRKHEYKYLESKN